MGGGSVVQLYSVFQDFIHWLTNSRYMPYQQMEWARLLKWLNTVNLKHFVEFTFHLRPEKKILGSQNERKVQKTEIIWNGIK